MSNYNFFVSATTCIDRSATGTLLDLRGFIAPTNKLCSAKARTVVCNILILDLVVSKVKRTLKRSMCNWTDVHYVLKGSQ